VPSDNFEKYSACMRSGYDPLERKLADINRLYSSIYTDITVYQYIKHDIFLFLGNKLQFPKY